MNNEIKQGDKVRVSKDVPKLYTEGWSCNWLDCDLCVTQIDGDAAEVKRINDNDEWFYLSIPCKYLVKVDAEAKEPKFKVGDKVRYVGDMQPTYKGKAFVIDGEVFFNNHYNEWQTRSIKPFAWDGLSVCNVPLSDLAPYAEPTEQPKASADVLGEFTPIPRFDNPIIGFEQAYWQEYEADLAKEIAVMLVRTHRNDLNKVAKMSVDIAKAVVKNLKKK